MGSVSTDNVYYLRYRSIGLTTENGNSPPDPGPFFFGGVGYSSHREDEGPVANYRELIASGQNATSILVGERRKVKSTLGKFVAKRDWGDNTNWDWTVVEGDLAQPFSPNGLYLNPDDVKNLARMDFHKRVMRALNSLEGQVFLGELRETLHMIKRPAFLLRLSLDDYMKLLKGRRTGNRTQREKTVTNAWLEYTYGIKPLIDDVQGGLEHLRRFAAKRPAFRFVKGTASSEFDFSPEPLTIGAGLFEYDINRKYTCTVNATIRGTVKLSTGGAEARLDDLGFRKDRFIPTLWELIPYSFVVDYFTNVGDIISSWALGTKFLNWAALTVRTSTDYIHTVPACRRNSLLDPSFGCEIQENVPCEFRGSHVLVQRDKTIDTLIPSFRIEIPGLTSLRWLNLAALANQRKALTPF